MLLSLQADINSIAVLLLLLIIIYFVSGIELKIKNLRKSTIPQYLNTQAKLKAVGHAPNAIIVIDVDGLIVAWTGGSKNMFGYNEEEVLGKSLSEICIPDRYKPAHEKGILEAKLSGKSKIAGKNLKLEGKRRGGEEFPIDLILSQWKDGINTFYTGVIKDCSKDLMLEQKLEQMMTMYTKCEEISKSGCWEWNVLTDIINVSKGFEKIFDIEKDEMNSTYLLKRIYHEDLPEVEKVIKKAFQNKTGYMINYRIVCRDGNTTHVQANTDTELDSKGNLYKIFGTIHRI